MAGRLRKYKDDTERTERVGYGARRPGGQVKKRRSVWFANRFGSMRSTGARPSLIRASAPLMLLSSLLRMPPSFPTPQTLLHHNSIRFNPLPPPVRPAFLQICPLPLRFPFTCIPTAKRVKPRYLRKLRTERAN